MCHVPPLVYPGDLLSSRTDTTGDGKSLWFLRWTYRWTCALEIIGGVYEADVRYQKFSSLCYPAQQAMQTKFRKTVDNADGGVYQNPVHIAQFWWSAFCQNSFHQKKKSMNLYEQKFGNPQRVPCPDVVTVFRQKKAEHSVTDNVVWRAFLNTVQLHPLWVKLYQLDREDQALLVGLPVGEGDALWAELCEGPFGQWSQSSSCRKSWKFIWVGGLINFVGSMGRRNQFAKISTFNYSYSSAPIFSKGPMLTKIQTS